MSLSLPKPGFRASAVRALGYVASSPLASPILKVAGRMRGGLGFVVLTYHRVGGGGDPFFLGIDPEVFRRQMELLSSRWHVLPLSELIERLEADDLPDPAAAITFDDNYASVHELALPILQELGLSATIFAPTAPLENGGQPLWFDRVLHAYKHATRPAAEGSLPGPPVAPEDSADRRCQAVLAALAWMKTLGEPERAEALVRIERTLAPAPLEEEYGHRMASWDDLHRWLDAGGEVGSHTVTHPILSRLSPERAREELTDSRRTLERGLGIEVRTLAYPNGGSADINDRVRREVAAAGYDVAFSTELGINRVDWRKQRFELERIDAAETGARHLMLRLAALELAA